MDLTDEALYAQFLSGDEEAFSILLNLYREKLTLFLYGITGNMEDAEELISWTCKQHNNAESLREWKT